MTFRPASRALSPFWAWWTLGGGSFLLGIMLVGAIPGDQVFLSNVLTATWPICTVVGIRSSHTAFWRSPLAVWAVVAMASVSIARWFLSDTTVRIFLLIWTIGLLAAVIWWFRVSRSDTYLSPGTGDDTFTTAEVAPASADDNTEEDAVRVTIHGVEPVPNQPRRRVMSVDQVKGLLVILPIMALGALIFGFVSNSEANATRAERADISYAYGPACTSYFESIETYEEAFAADYPPDCLYEIQLEGIEASNLDREASQQSNRAAISFVVAAVAAIGTAWAWWSLRPRRQERS